MLEPRALLDAMIEEYLVGWRSISGFSKDFSSFYIEEVPDNALSEEEFDWYGMIHEKLEWTAEAPPVEDQNLGWLSPNQFTSWLREHLKEKPARR